MADKTWKAVERRLAERLGGERLGCTGRRGADVVSDWLAVEVKSRRRLPRWIIEALEQARAGAGDRLPVAILHEVGSRHSQDLVLMALKDFVDWFGPLGDQDTA